MAPRYSATIRAAFGLACVTGIGMLAWSFRRPLLTEFGFDPSRIVFGLAILSGLLTIISSWAPAYGIAQRASEVPREGNSGRWLYAFRTFMFHPPAALLWTLGLLNVLLLTFAFGFVRGDEVMAKEAESASTTTTIRVGGFPIGDIRIGPARHLQKELGFAFVYPLPGLIPLSVLTDGPGNPTLSGTVVYEDSKPIGPPHSVHASVREAGRGAYSHWGAGWSNPSGVYFSATDNTDPTNNGRMYRVEYVFGLHPAIFALGILLSAPLYLGAYGSVMSLGHRWIPAATGTRWPLSTPTIGLIGICLFLLPLIAYWQTGKTTYSVIGGLLPWSDASDWLHGTFFLMSKEGLYWWTARRPIAPIFTGFLAMVTGQDLQAVLLLRTVLTAIGCLLVAFEIARSYGATAGFAALATILAFVSPFTPTTLTEGLGLAFGSTAFAIMWQAIIRDSILRFAAGLFLLTLAMSIRPGPVLVLPFLALWAAVCLGRNRGNVISRLSLFGFSGAAALTVTFAWTYSLGTVESYPTANYAFTFYGLAFGGKPWQSFFIDFPDAKLLSEAAQGTFAYHAGFERILRNPGGLLIGLWSFTRLYLDNLFVYVEVPGFRLLAQLLAGLGVLIAGLRMKRDLLASFLIWGAAGVVLSAPFLFWGLDAYRAFIPTAPIEAGIVALGAAALIHAARFPIKQGKRVASPPFHPAQMAPALSPLTTAVAIVLVLACTVAPAISLALDSPPRFESERCKGELTPSIIHLGKSSPYIEVIADGMSGRLGPTVAVSNFRADRNFAGVEIREALTTMGPGNLLIHSYDLLPASQAQSPSDFASSRQRWMIATVSQMPMPGVYYFVCGRVKRFPADQEKYSVTYVETAQPIVPLGH